MLFGHTILGELMSKNYREQNLDLAEMELLESGLKEINCYDNPSLSAVTGYILEQGGKRMRPLLVFLSSDIYGASLESRVDVALATELIHSASLLHDDVVDKSPLRRGQASANGRWGNPTAVLAGDYLFARAYGILSRYPKILAIITEAISTMCLGELRQLYTHFDPNTSPEDYISTVIGKTASLLVASCHCGAALTPMPTAEIDLMKKFGLHLGIAYQILDDIADYVWDADRTGKPGGCDIRNGVVTLPLMYLLVNPKTAPRISDLLKQRMPLTPWDFAQELRETRAIEKAGGVACQYLERCLDLADKLPRCPATSLLKEMVQQIQDRCNTLLNNPVPPQPAGQLGQYPNSNPR